MSLETDFQSAASRSRTLPEQPNDVLLALYGLFKQATQGDVSGEEPGTFDFVGRAKYDAWAALQGVTREEAMQRYIATVDRLSG